MLLQLLPLLSALSGAALAATPVTYVDALDEALEANTSVLGAEADYASAEGRLLSATGTWDPTLTANLSQNTNLEQGRFQSFGYESDTTNRSWAAGLSQTFWTGTSWGIDYSGNNNNQFVLYPESGAELDVDSFSSNLSASITQQLLKGWKMSYNLQAQNAARRGMSISEAGLVQTRQAVLAGTARAYWDLYAAGRQLEVADRAVRVTKEEERIVEAQVEAGNMAPIELTRVAAALAQAELNRINAKMGLQSASDALALQIGRDPGEALEPVTAPGAPPSVDIDVDAAREAALEGNPGLLIQRVNLDGAEIELANARHGRLPTLSVTGRFGLNGYAEENSPTYADAFSEMMSFDYQNRYLGANVSTPLGWRSERGNVQSAAGSVEKAKVDLLASEREVSQQVGALVRTIENAQKSVQLAELNLKLAEETLAAEKARQEVGRAIQKDILEAQRARDNAESGLITARIDYRKALVDLKALQGKL